MKRAHPFSQQMVPEETDKGVAVPLHYGSEDHIKPWKNSVSLRGKKMPSPTAQQLHGTSFLQAFFLCQAGSFSKVNKTPIKCLQEEMLQYSFLSFAELCIYTHAMRSLWYH